MLDCDGALEHVISGGELRLISSHLLRSVVHLIIRSQMPLNCDKKLDLSDNQKLDILLGICSALVYMHSSNRNSSSREPAREVFEEDDDSSQSHSHRDLKPENIMYQDGIAKVIDFGVAKMSRHSTRGTSVQGTYNWMAPEQALTDTRKIYTQCDIFSFGLILKWLMVGDREAVPFKDAPTDQIIMEHRRIHASGGAVVHPFVADLSLVRPEFRVLIQFCTVVDAKKRWTAPKVMWELRQLKSRLAFAFPSAFGGGAGVQGNEGLEAGPFLPAAPTMHQLPASPQRLATPPKTGRVSPVPSSTPLEAFFYIGARVRLEGLKSHPELNGSTGVINRAAANGRWVLKLDSDNSEKEVSPQNITHVLDDSQNFAVAWCEEKALHLRTVDALNASKKLVLEGDARWVLDSSKTACHRCSSQFSLFTRRHHCRVCGDLFCSACSSHRKRGCQSCCTMLETGRCACSTPNHRDLIVCSGCQEQGCSSPETCDLQRQSQSECTRIALFEQRMRLSGVTTEPKSLINAGCTIMQLKRANVDVSIGALKASGCDARVLKGAGADALALKVAGFDSSALLQAAFDVSCLLDAKFSVFELKSSGASASALRSG